MIIEVLGWVFIALVAMKVAAAIGAGIAAWLTRDWGLGSLGAMAYGGIGAAASALVVVLILSPLSIGWG